jgi:hypothetical protein
VGQRSDQVFQLSLTEIAFTIVFILLLLLGYLVFKEQTERHAAERTLAQVQSVEQATQVLDETKREFTATIRAAGAANPDEVITRLIQAEAVRSERDVLKREVEDLNAKLSALVEVQNVLTGVAGSGRDAAARTAVTSALALQQQVHAAMREQAASELAPAPPPQAKPVSSLRVASAATSAPMAASTSTATAASRSADGRALSPAEQKKLDQDALSNVRQALQTDAAFRRHAKEQLRLQVRPGKEAQTVAEVIRAAKGYAELTQAGVRPDAIRKENSDLRGQVAFLKNKLDARGGRDWPPCWADEEGKVEFLFSVELRPDAVVVSPAWPTRRDADAKGLPGVDELTRAALSFQSFQAQVQGIFDWSRRHDPQCRHYVYLRSAITDAVQSDRARLMVENFFYKTEVRR